MIPKVIHYCWVGDAPLPAKQRACIASWKRVMPDAEIREWNETNYDFHKNAYMDEAYRAKKWGFVPDYARLDIVYRHGGIYLDTDVEMLKPLDPLLGSAFCGFESKEFVALGLIFAAEPGNATVKAMRDAYDGLHFANADGSLNQKPSPQLQTEQLRTMGLRDDDGTVQTVADFKVYPKDYFAPKSLDGSCHLTENSYCIHHYEASWVPLRWKIFRKVRMALEALLGKRVTMLFVRVKRLIWPEFV
jgi:hypothetical protein